MTTRDDRLIERLADALLRAEEGAADPDFPETSCEDADRLARCLDLARALSWSGGAEAGAATDKSKIGSYSIESEIGRGGMGVVYRAVDPSGRPCALKLLKPELLPSSTARERFRREAAALSRLAHPGIVSVFDSGDDARGPFLAMELVDGETASALAAARGGRLSPTDAARLVRDAAEALEHAHARGVVHRDVKPSNVLVGRNGRALVCDFGLARDDEASAMTRTGFEPGTDAYMAPEQLSGDAARVGPRTDVYGLGATLYELLAGRPPYSAASRAALLSASAQPPLPPSRFAPGVSWDLDTACLTALEREPERRYASAADLARDLDRTLMGEPIAARRPGPIRRLRRFAARRPAAAAALFGLIVVAALAFVFERSARRRVEIEATKTTDALRRRDREALRAEASADLLSELLAGADPWAFGAAPEATRTAIEGKIREFVAAPYEGDAVSRAADLSRLARAATAAGLKSAALDVYAAALDAARGDDEASGLADALRAEAAVANFDAGRFDAARGLIAEAGERLGVAQSAVVRARLAEARGLLSRLDGKAAESLPSLAAARDALDREHPLRLRLDGMIAVATSYAGRSEEAVALAAAFRSETESAFGGASYASIEALETEANVLRRAGRIAEALATQRRAVESLRARLPENRPERVRAEALLAAIVFAAGDHDAFAKEVEGLLDRLADGGVDDGLLAELAFLDGVRHSNARRADQALKRFERALPAATRVFGEASSDVAAILRGIGRAYAANGELAKAREAFDAAVRSLDAARNGATPDMVGLLSDLSATLMRLEAWDDLVAATVRVEKVAPPGSVETATALYFRGRAFVAIGRKDEAVLALTKSLDLHRMLDGVSKRAIDAVEGALARARALDDAR
jgi:eukaryotic-like serine/threonine-protein kinase